MNRIALGIMISLCALPSVLAQDGKTVSVTQSVTVTADPATVDFIITLCNDDVINGKDILEDQAKKVAEKMAAYKVESKPAAPVHPTAMEFGRQRQTTRLWKSLSISIPLKNPAKATAEAAELATKIEADSAAALGALNVTEKPNVLAMSMCKAFAEAEEIYRRTDYDGDGILEYAQSLRGANSLLERNAGTGDLALIDKTFAAASGKPSEKPTPKGGYCFKVLTAQGAKASGGKRNYIVNGNMTLGYALIAYPAKYGIPGRRCYSINNNGTIFWKDLGAATDKVVENLTEFMGDDGWEAVEDDGAPTTQTGIVFHYSSPSDVLLKKAAQEAQKLALAKAKVIAESLGFGEVTLETVEHGGAASESVRGALIDIYRMGGSQGNAEADQPQDRVYSDNPSISYNTSFRFTFKAK